MAEGSFFVCLLCVLLSVTGSLGSDLDIPGLLQRPEVDKCDGKVENCYCTDRVIDCNGPVFTDITTLYPFISINVSRISINGGLFLEIPDNLFHSHHEQQFHQLTYLDLSNNRVQIMGYNAFKSLTKLKTLDLSNNNIELSLFESKNHESPFANLKQLHELKLHKAFNVMSDEWPSDVGDLFNETYLPHLKVLDLSSNGFSDHYGKLFPKFLCNNSVTLTSLNLADNKFDRFLILPCMNNMLSLDYSNNSLEFLTVVEMDVIESFLGTEEIKLGGNPFRCDCMFIDTLEWMNTTDQPLDFKNIVCGRNSHDASMIGKPVLTVHLNASEVCEEPRVVVCYFGPVTVHLSHSTFIAIVVASCVLVAVGIAGVIVLIRRGRRKNRAIRVPTEGPKIPPYDRMI